MPEYRFDELLVVIVPHTFFAGNCHDIGLRALLEPLAQGAIVAIHAIACGPGKRDASRCRAFEHLLSQFGLGGKRALVRYARAATALAVIGPSLSQIQLAVQQRMAKLSLFARLTEWSR